MKDMRIIGGEFRGRRIKHPDTEGVRPTKDRIRESVVNMLMQEIPGSTVLDLFAGSGAYGLEALSRGAEKAVFVEKNRICSGVIKENIRSLGIEDYAEVITRDVSSQMEEMGEENRHFDLIFADPPYRADMAKNILIIINHYDILEPSGILVIEHHRRETIPEEEGNVSILKQKTYGNTVISVFRRK